MLVQYACPGCQNSIAAPFLYSRMQVTCPDCGNVHAPPEIPPVEQRIEWTPSGEPDAIYPVAKSTLATQQVLFLLVILAGMGLAGVGLWILIANPGQVSVLFQWGLALALLCLGGLIAKTGWNQLRAISERGRRMAVCLYPEGFSVAGFGHSGACRWDDIQAILLAHAMTSPYLDNNPILVAKRSGGGELVDSALHANPQVVAALQERSLPHLVPIYLEALSNGQRISFIDYAPPPTRDDPTFHLTAEGVEFGDRKIGWEDVKSLSFRRANLTIVPTQGKKISYNNPLTIPNVHVLAAILGQKAHLSD